MRVKMRLVAVINIQRAIEEQIALHQQSILDNVLTGSVELWMTTLLKLQDQLTVVKEVVQHANKSKAEGKRTNNYFIYRKANLEKFRKFLIELRDKINENPKSNPTMTVGEIDEREKNVKLEIKQIKTKLSKFNMSKKVFVEFDESLVGLFPALPV